MGLQAALVDRARRISEEPTAEKIEGTTTFVAVISPWFRARLTMPSAPRTEAASRVRARLTDDSGARTRSVERPYIMFGIKDLEGNSLIGEDGRCAISSQDRIEVSSAQLGDFIYEIVEEPTPIRKKRKIMGYTVGLSRVAEHEFVEATP